jgi:hypothetical protein
MSFGSRCVWILLSRPAICTKADIRGFPPSPEGTAEIDETAAGSVRGRRR